MDLGPRGGSKQQGREKEVEDRGNEDEEDEKGHPGSASRSGLGHRSRTVT